MDTKKLRQKILDLAIRGKLVPQDPNDEPASVLLERIKAEKERLIKEGKIKKSKKSAKTSDTHHYEQVLPNGWCLSTLGEVFTLQAGKNITAKDIKEIATELHPYKCYGGNGIRGFVMSYNREGDFPIIGRQGALCGNINIAKGKFYATEHAVVVERYCDVNFMWAYYTLTTLNLNQYATATAQPGLSVAVINDVCIPIPPRKEQERISKKIGYWFALIDQIEKSKSDLQATIKQTKSKILDLAIHGKLVPQNPNDEPAIELLKRINPEFTPCDNGHYTFEIPNLWTWCKLGDIAQSNIGLTYKPTDITDNGIPVYRSNNIRDRKIDKSDLVRVNAPILEKQFLNIGDLLICARNGSRRLVGKCAIIEELDEATSFGAFMAVCRSEYNQWIFNLLNTTYFDRYLDDSNSTAINQVTQKMLLALHIPLPPLSEQQRIVQKIEELFSILDNIQNALEV